MRRGIFKKRGMLDEAFASARSETSTRGDTELLEALDRGWEEGGYTRALVEAARLMESRSDTMYIAPSQIYELYFEAEMWDEGMQWLERAFDLRDPQLPYLPALWIFRPLRGTERFERLLGRMRLPEAAGRAG